MIKKIIVGALRANCYVVYNQESKVAFVVDPGADYKKISRFLKENMLTLKGIFLTHGHIDHIGATNSFLVDMPNLPIYIHQEDEMFLKDPSMNLSQQFSSSSYTVHANHLIILHDGDCIELGGMHIICRHYPGHTPGSCMFFVEEEHVIFSGDVLFSKSIGRFDLPYGNRSDMILSLRKIKSIQGHYDIYPGHEEKTTLQTELLENPYLLQV